MSCIRYALTVPEYSIVVKERSDVPLGTLHSVRSVLVSIVGAAAFVTGAGIEAIHRLRAQGFDAAWAIPPRPNKRITQYSHGCVVLGREIPQ